MAQEKEYFAFISYQRKDEEWADRLRSKLEHYRLPSSVRKQDASLPKEIRPIFRDALELAGGVLAKEIETALRQSKFLIVICSPNSANSPWVNKEIQTFIDLGREDRIIPFIIDGTPFSENEDTECFPPALRSLKGEKELLGININELSRDAASIKVVARMFGLKFDALWQRYEREKRRKRWMWIGGATLLAILGLCIGGYFVKQNRTIEKQNERLQQDSVIMANHLMRIQGDSILLSAKNDSITNQNMLIKNQRDSLDLSNKLLAEERDNVLRANWKMMENQARFISEKASLLCDEGDSYLARLLALEVLPRNQQKLERPYVVNAEHALRKAINKSSTILQIPSLVNKKKWRTPQFILSPNGKYLAYGSVLWDTSTGGTISGVKIIKYINGEFYEAFSPDSKKILSTDGNGLVSIWDTDTWEHVCSVKGSTLLDINHNKLATLYKSIICVYNLETGDSVTSIDVTKIAINKPFIKYSPDGKYLIFINTLPPYSRQKDLTIIKIWDANTYDEIGSIETDSKIKDILFNPRYNQMLCVTDSVIRVWDTVKFDSVATLKGHKYEINSLCLNRNGDFIVTGSNDKTIRIYSAKTFKCVKVIKEHSKAVKTICSFNNNNYFISASNDSTIKVWDATTYNCISELRGYTSGAIQLSNNGNILFSLSLDGIRILDSNAFLQKNILENSKDVYGLYYYPETAQLMGTGNDGFFRIWDIRHNKLINTINLGPIDIGKGIVKYTHRASFSARKKIIAKNTEDGTIKIWDVESGRCIKVLGKSVSYSRFAFISKDGLFVTARGPLFLSRTLHSDSTWIWSTETGKQINVFPAKKDTIFTYEVIPNKQQIISIAHDSIICLHDIKTSKCVKTLYGHKKIINSINLTDDGQTLITSSEDNTIRIWNLQNNRSFILPSLSNILAMSPNGRQLLSAGNYLNYGTITLWDINSGKKIREYDGHRDGIRKLAFNSDGNYFTSISYDGKLKIWN